jgi:rod shape-determining protein MreD
MRYKIVVYSICIYSFMLLQSTVLDYVKIYGIKPNLLLVFIISVALLRGNVEGAAVGFFAGLTHDVIGGKVLGFYSLLGMYTGLILGSVNRRLYRENIFLAVFFTFLSSIVYEGLVCFFGVGTKSYENLLYLFRSFILPEAIYNSIVSIFIFIFIVRISYKFENLSNSQRKY